MMFGVIEVFNILHNYAICSQKIHLTWYSTVIKTFAKQNRHKIAKRNLFYGFDFSFFNRQSTFHGCYCGLWKCRVIIATCVPTTATVGPPFVWMVWEWEDTNIRWHRKKREFETIWYLVTHPIRHLFHLFWWGFIITFTFLDCDLPVAVWRIRRTEEPPAGKADMSPAGVRDPITNLHIQAPWWWWWIMIMVRREIVFVAMFVITMMIIGGWGWSWWW